MKEFLIFFIIFLIVMLPLTAIFNGRYIYSQTKYFFIGTPPTSYYSQVSPAQVERAKVILPDKLTIPSIGIEAPVLIAQSENEGYLQGLLESGVIYYPGSSALNQKGTMVIVGHSSAYPWYKGQYGSIFALLNKANLGDEIIIASGTKQFIYKITDKQIKAPKDLVFEKDKNNAVLYLVSCWPVNTAWKRIVVKAVQGIDKN